MLGFGKITQALETIQSQLTTLHSRQRYAEIENANRHETVLGYLRDQARNHTDLIGAVVTHQHLQATEPERAKAERAAEVAENVAPVEEEKTPEPVEETSPAQAEAETSVDIGGTAEPEEDASEAKPEPVAA